MKLKATAPIPSILATAVSLMLVATAARSEDVALPQAASPVPGTSASAAADGAAGFALERVVVTAQKRPQFAEKVPMSLSALSQDALDKQNVVNIQDLARLTPGLTALSSDVFGTPNISIRGVASTAGSATTAIYINDAPIATRSIDYSTGGNAYPQLFDLDRVEVLRGPQGTLFGSGAEGGAIRFISPTPNMNRFGGVAHIGIAGGARGAGSYEAGAAVGGPLIADELAFRTSVWRKHEGGYIDHVNRNSGAITGHNTNGQDATVVHADLLWRPTAALTIAPSIYYQNTVQSDRATWYEEAGTFRTYNHLLQPTRDRFTLSSVSVDYEMESVQLKSVTSWFDRRMQRVDDFSYLTAAPFTGGANNEELPGHPDYLAINRTGLGQRVLTQEFRLSSNADGTEKFSWVAGLYFSRARQTNPQSIEQDMETFSQALFGASSADVFGQGGVGPGGIYSYTNDAKLQDRNIAVFGEANYKITPHTTLTAGLRIGRSSFDFSSDQDGPVAGGPTHFAGTQRGKSFLPKIALSQEVTAADLVYASASKGDRVGGANPSLAGITACAADLEALGMKDNPHTYGGDSLWSYELGYKTRVLDQRLEIAASIFRINWNDIQQNVLLPTCLFSYTTNLGQARSQGGDLQLQFRATRNLLLSASVAYTDARFTQTTGGSPSTPAVNAGDRLAVSPFSLALGAEYAWASREGTKAFARIDYQHQSAFDRTGSQGTLSYDADLLRAPATNYFSLRGGYTVGKMSYAVYVDNLFDTRTQTMRTRNAPGDPYFQAMTFRPRTFGLTATHKF